MSGATTANWVAKSASLLHDGLGGPDRVGLLLPLHWQGVALLLAGVTAGATVVLADEPGELAGCQVAFVHVDAAEAALDAGVDEVLALSCHPLGLPVAQLPPGVTDYAREVPGYADRWGGPLAREARLELGGRPVVLPAAGDVGPTDRVLITLPTAQALGVVLQVLRAGAALVLVPDASAVDLTAVVRTEGVTATAGTAVSGVRGLA